MWANKLRVLFNKMAGSNGTLIAMRMVRSKLRKREESNNNNNNSRRHGNNAVHPQDGVVATTPVLTAKSADLPVVANGQSHLSTGLGHTAVEVTEITVDGDAVEMKTAGCPATAAQMQSQQPLQLCIWNMPTTRSTCGTQVSLYSGDQTALVQNHLQGEIPRECNKGLRKNLRGKWKRLVQKKQPNPEMFSIPPELRPQLKQIYVY